MVTSQPTVEESGRCLVEAKLETSEVKKKPKNLESVVQSHDKKLHSDKDQLKPKWKDRLPILRRQASKEKSDDREKKRDSLAKKQPDRTEADIEQQNLLVAKELSEKDEELRMADERYIALLEKLKSEKEASNSLRSELTKAKEQCHDEVDRLQSEIDALRKQIDSSDHVEVMLVPDDNTATEKQHIDARNIAGLRSRVIRLEADLEKASKHSKKQSREILNLKQELDGTKVSQRP